MSRFAKLLIGILVAGCAAFAQDSAQTPPATAAPDATSSPKRMHGDQAEHRLKRLSKRLNLTDDQKEKIRPILQDEDKQITSLESDSTMSAQQKHKKMREIRMSSRSQMAAILTPEQKEKIQGGRMHEGNHRMRHEKATSATTDSTTTEQQ